jgi:hypothetical protein
MLRSMVDVPGQLNCAPFAGHVLEPDGARRVAGAERMRRLPPANFSARSTIGANVRRDRPALVAPIAAALGHEVIAREIEVADVGAVTARAGNLARKRN